MLFHQAPMPWWDAFVCGNWNHFLAWICIKKLNVTGKLTGKLSACLGSMANHPKSKVGAVSRWFDSTGLSCINSWHKNANGYHSTELSQFELAYPMCLHSLDQILQLPSIFCFTHQTQSGNASHETGQVSNGILLSERTTAASAKYLHVFNKNIKYSCFVWCRYFQWFA